MNKVSGGNEDMTGKVDLNPDVLKYIVDFYSGGAGKFYTSKLPTYLYRTAAGLEVEKYQVPFLSRLSGKVLPYADQERFYDSRNKVLQIDAHWETLAEKGREGERADFLKEYGGELSMLGLLDETQKDISMYRGIRAHKYTMDLTPVELEAEIDRLDILTKGVVDRFNKKYDEKTGYHD
jgi:hypothetical protein